MRTFEQLPEHPVVQPLVFPGFMLVNAECRLCGHTMLAVAPIGTEGITCPGCGHQKPDFAWVPEQRTEIGHDGAWLMGIVDLVGFTDGPTVIDMLDEAYAEDDEDWGYPWFVKLLAFLMVVRNILLGKAN